MILFEKKICWKVAEYWSQCPPDFAQPASIDERPNGRASAETVQARDESVRFSILLTNRRTLEMAEKETKIVGK